MVFDADSPLDGMPKPAAPVVDAAPYKKLDLIVETHPRQSGRGKGLAERAVDVVQFYESIIGDSPYSAFTLARHRDVASRRPQSRVLRGPESAGAQHRDHVAQRSGVVRELPGVLPGARSRAPVVGTGGRLAQLPRAMAQRGVRAVLRRALRAEIPRRRRVWRRHSTDAPVGR